MQLLRHVRVHPPDALAPALDRQLARAVGPIALVLALMYASSVVHRAVNPVLLATTPPTQVVLVGGFLAVAVLVRWRPLPAELANVTVLVSLGLIAVDTLIRGQAAAGVNLHWALIGIGAVALRPRWWLAFVAAVVVPWVVAAALGLAGWTFSPLGFSIDMATATALGAVVFRTRRDAITSLEAARRSLQRLAGDDALTGLLNRRGIEQAAAEALATATPGSVAILFVDLDGFKEVNDRFGHAEGDRALVAVADLLRRTLRAADRVARVGGDEFVALLAAPANPDAAAKRVRDAFASWRAPGDRYGLRVSVGVERVAGQDLEAFWEAVDEADARMYAQKRGGTPAPDAAIEGRVTGAA